MRGKAVYHMNILKSTSIKNIGNVKRNDLMEIETKKFKNLYFAPHFHSAILSVNRNTAISGSV